MSTTLQIKRKSRFTASLMAVSIWVDDQELGSVKNGKSISFQITEGSHRVYFKNKTMKSRTVEILLKQNETCTLECEVQMSWFAIGSLSLDPAPGNSIVKTLEPEPHHAILVLIFGILGLGTGILGLAALGQGIIDIKKMNSGKMDPSGRSFTLIGTVLGGISVGFALLLVLLLMLLF